MPFLQHQDYTDTTGLRDQAREKKTTPGMAQEETNVQHEPKHKLDSFSSSSWKQQQQS